MTSPASSAAVHVGASKNHFRAQVTAAATGITHGKGRTAFPAYTRAMKQSPAKTLEALSEKVVLRFVDATGDPVCGLFRSCRAGE